MNVTRNAALLAGVLLGASPGGASAVQSKAANEPAGAAVSRATLQERYGIRLDRIAVTGAGGLVDLRFTVVDPAKARPLLANHARMPRLMASGGNLPLEAPHGAMSNVRLKPDAACFMLFPNARGAIRTGTPVSVLFGDVRLEPIPAN